MHDGGISGFGSTHFFLPAQRFGGVILGNAGDATDLVPLLAQERIDEVLGVPKAERPDWEGIQKRKAERQEEEMKADDEEAIKRFFPDLEGNSQPQTIPLSAYTGEYWNAGYRMMRVEEKDDKLFIDASDRSMAFTITFEHVGGQSRYVAHLSDVDEGGDERLAAEFVFEGGKVVRMGVHLETDLEGLIWFDKRNGEEPEE